MRVLSVAEKPSVAKELAKIIAGNGQPNRRVGPSPYNHIFDIRGCSFKNQNCDMSITSVTGHLMEIEFDIKYKGWKSCAPLDLFTAPINRTVKKENEPIRQNLADEARKCNVLLLWLDCDLEGENICFEVISVCKEANPRLDVYRARFSALIPRDILRTLQFPERPNENYTNAVDARQEIDLRLGAAFTRFQTLRLKEKFPALENTTISYGPCQFPTLGFVVERHLQIQAFRPENYWMLSCAYDKQDEENGGNISCNFSWSRGHVYDQFVCSVLFESCVGTGDNVRARVTKCESVPSSRYRPAPLNTIELQKKASVYLRMSSERTMHIAEALYQQGILSYPRTETDFFKEGFEIHPLLEDHRGHPDWGQFVSGLLDTPGKFLWPKNGGRDDQAHPPIHPTKCVELGTLQGEERAVYELVCRHFFACCARDGIGQMTNISIAVYHDQDNQGKTKAEDSSHQISMNNMLPDDDDVHVHCEYFSTSGLMVLERNWLEVYSKYESWHGNKVPRFQVGDIFKPSSVIMSSGRTVAPPPLSEVELISDMDKNGIGTDATIATHIATIQQREYAYKDPQNRFIPTKLGLALIEGYNSMGYQLNKPYLRATMEKDCQQVSRGLMRKDEMVANCLQNMKECFITCNREAVKLDTAMRKYYGNDNDAAGGGGSADTVYQIAAPGLSACGVCQGAMDLRIRPPAANSGGNGITSRQLYCATCRESHPLPSNGDLRPHDHRCPLCRFQVLIVTNTETGKEHTVCPYCFRNPPPPPHSLEEAAGTEFRCFNCANEACPLAGRIVGGDINISPCLSATCNEHMRLKKTKTGFMLSCTKQGCNQVFWLPKFVKSVVPLSDICSACSNQCGAAIHRMKIVCSLAMAPPGIAPESTVCPCCDAFWSDCHINKMMKPPRKQTASSSAYQNQLGSFSERTANPGMTLGTTFHSAASLDFGASRNPASSTSSAHVVNHGTASSSISGSSSSDYGAALTGVGFVTSKRGGAAAANGRIGHKKTQNTTTTSSATSAPEYANHNNAASGDMLELQCQCGLPSLPKTVTKDGPNKGRLFYSCSNQRRDDPSSGCKFFQWQDELPASNEASGFSDVGGGRQSNRGRGRGGRSGSRLAGHQGGRVAADTDICSHCKCPGHYARSCPNK